MRFMAVIYASSGQVGGPKGLLLDVPSDRSIEEVRAEFGIP